MIRYTCSRCGGECDRSAVDAEAFCCKKCGANTVRRTEGVEMVITMHAKEGEKTCKVFVEADLDVRETTIDTGLNKLSEVLTEGIEGVLLDGERVVWLWVREGTKDEVWKQLGER